MLARSKTITSPYRKAACDMDETPDRLIPAWVSVAALGALAAAVVIVAIVLVVIYLRARRGPETDAPMYWPVWEGEPENIIGMSVLAEAVEAYEGGKVRRFSRTFRSAGASEFAANWRGALELFGPLIVSLVRPHLRERLLLPALVEAVEPPRIRGMGFDPDAGTLTVVLAEYERGVLAGHFFTGREEIEVRVGYVTKVSRPVPGLIVLTFILDAPILPA